MLPRQGGRRSSWSTNTFPMNTSRRIFSFPFGFGFVFLGLEVVIKVAASAIMRARDKQGSAAAGGEDAATGHAAGVEAAFAVLLVLAVGAAAAMHCTVWERPDGAGRGGYDGVYGNADGGSYGDGGDGGNGEGAAPRVRCSRHRLTLALRLLARPDRLMLLLAPFQVAFGLMASMLAFYVNGDVAKAAVGGDNVAFLNAVLAATAALLSPVLGWLGQRGLIGKHALLHAGLAAFLVESAMLRGVPKGGLQRQIEKALELVLGSKKNNKA